MRNIYQWARDFRQLHLNYRNAHIAEFQYRETHIPDPYPEVGETWEPSVVQMRLRRELADRYDEWQQAINEACQEGMTAQGGCVELSRTTRHPASPVGIVCECYFDSDEKADVEDYIAVEDNNLSNPIVAPMGLLRHARRYWPDLTDDEKSVLTAVAAGWLSNAITWTQFKRTGDGDDNFAQVVGEVPVALARVEAPRLLIVKSHPADDSLEEGPGVLLKGISRSQNHIRNFKLSVTREWDGSLDRGVELLKHEALTGEGDEGLEGDAADWNIEELCLSSAMVGAAGRVSRSGIEWQVEARQLAADMERLSEQRIKRLNERRGLSLCPGKFFEALKMVADGWSIDEVCQVNDITAAELKAHREGVLSAHKVQQKKEAAHFRALQAVAKKT